MSATPLGARDRLFLNRFSFGHTNQLAKQVHRAGGGRAWFEKQLRPGSIKDKKGNAVKGWFPTLWHSPRTLWTHQDTAPGWELMTDLSRWTMMRRVYSSHQLHEVMVDFWSNLLHVPLGDGLVGEGEGHQQYGHHLSEPTSSGGHHSGRRLSRRPLAGEHAWPGSSSTRCRD